MPINVVKSVTKTEERCFAGRFISKLFYSGILMRKLHILVSCTGFHTALQFSLPFQFHTFERWNWWKIYFSLFSCIYNLQFPTCLPVNSVILLRKLQILVCGAEDFVILDLKFNFHYFYSPFPISQLWNVKLSKISKFWNHFDLFAILQFFTTLKFSSLTPRCKPGIEMAALNIQLIIIIGMKVKVIFNGIGKSGKSWCISMYEN